MSEERARYDSGHSEINRNALLLFEDPRFEPPTANDLRALMKRTGLTGSEVGLIVGVDSRTVRKWTGAERDMPYSAWRLLLLDCGIASVESEEGGPAFLGAELTTLRVAQGVGVFFTTPSGNYLLIAEALTDVLQLPDPPTAEQLSPHWPRILRAARYATTRGATGALLVREEEIRRAEKRP